MATFTNGVEHILHRRSFVDKHDNSGQPSREQLCLKDAAQKPQPRDAGPVILGTRS